MKQIEDTNKWNNSSFLCIGSLSIVKIFILSKVIKGFNAIAIKMPSIIFIGLGANNLKIYLKTHEHIHTNKHTYTHMRVWGETN